MRVNAIGVTVDVVHVITSLRPYATFPHWVCCCVISVNQQQQRRRGQQQQRKQYQRQQQQMQQLLTVLCGCNCCLIAFQ